MVSVSDEAQQILNKHEAKPQVGAEGLYECPSPAHAEQCVEELADLFVIASCTGKTVLLLNVWG